MKDDIYRKLRLTEQEFGNGALANAIVLSNIAMPAYGGGVKHVYCPTVTSAILGGVSWEIARFFEDV